MAQAIDVHTFDELFDALFEELFVQCETADRLSDKLCSKLEKLNETERQQLVSRMNNDVTPLFIAAKRGVLDIVRYLLAKCKADVNQYCKCYGESEPEMTALMKAQNVDVARCFLEHGAKYKSTALRLHICSLRLEVADHLVSQGANINDELTEKYKTCLDYVNDDPQKYELFLKYGANVNVYNEDEGTPLQTAVKQNKLWQVEQLLKYGADPKNNNLQDDDDVLQLACLYGHEDIFNYLMDNVEYSDATRANAHELIGAVNVHYEKPCSNLMTLKHWTEALRIRLNNGGPFLERELRNEPIINDVREFRTMDDLQWIFKCPRSIIIQVLLIKHRILEFVNDDDDYNNLYYVYQVLKKKFEFKDALHFIMRFFRHLLDNDNDQIHTRETALEAVVVINNIVDNNGIEDVSNDFDDILNIVAILWQELFDPMVEKDVQIAIMSMLFVLFKIPKSRARLKRLKMLVTRMARDSEDKGLGILRMIACIKGALSIRCMNDVDPFPVVHLLLECGHHVEAVDLSSLSPLHLAVNKVCDLDLVNCLLEHEAHIERINTVDIRRCHLHGTVPEFKTFKYVTLKCLAARTIVKHEVPYNHLNFPALDTFIQMH